MIISIFLTGCNHVLKSSSGGCQEPVIICIPHDPSIIIEYPAATPPTPQQGEETIAIKTVQDSREYCSLLGAIAEREPS